MMDDGNQKNRIIGNVWHEKGEKRNKNAKNEREAAADVEKHDCISAKRGPEQKKNKEDRRKKIEVRERDGAAAAYGRETRRKRDRDAGTRTRAQAH